MRSLEARLKKEEAYSPSMFVVVAPPECDRDATALEEFTVWTKSQHPHTVVVVIPHACAGL
jgi:superfamily II RNA helicase